MLVKVRRLLLIAVVTALALVAMTFLGSAATPVEAAGPTVITVDSSVTNAVFGTIQVRAQGSGASAAALTGNGWDGPVPGVGASLAPGNPGNCSFPLSGSLSGSTLTLSGIVRASGNPAFLGAPVSITANTVTGAVTFNFAGIVFTGTGSVVVRHQ